MNPQAVFESAMREQFQPNQKTEFADRVREQLRHQLDGWRKMAARQIHDSSVNVPFGDVLFALKRIGCGYGIAKQNGQDVGVIFDLKDRSLVVNAANIDPLLSNRSLERLSGENFRRDYAQEQHQATAFLTGRLEKITLGGKIMNVVKGDADDPDKSVLMHPSSPSRRPTASSVPPPVSPVRLVHDGGPTIAAVPVPRPRPPADPSDRRVVMSSADLAMHRNSEIQLALTPEARSTVQDKIYQKTCFELLCEPGALQALGSPEQAKVLIANAKCHIDSLGDNAFGNKDVRMAMQNIARYESDSAVQRIVVPAQTESRGYGR